MKPNVDGIKNIILNFLIPLICITASGLLFALIIYPSIQNTPAIEQELSQKSNLKATLESKLSTLNNLVDYKSVVDENSALVDRVLVSEDAVPHLLNQVDTLAKNAGLDVTKLSYSYGEVADEAQSANYSIVIVSLGAEGTHSQLIAFLEAVERSARLINISNYRYAINSSDDDTLLSFNFSLSSPYLFVQSTAVTDEPVTLDISSAAFIDTIENVKSLEFYEVTESTLSVEATEETQESTPSEDIDE